jgi:Putative esterase
MRRFVLIALAAGMIAAPATAGADGSLYSGPPPRPGPDVLYAKPKAAPQLQNRGPWTARPLLVSGASGYRKGEFLYQDYIYDDHGAKGRSDPGDPRAQNTFSRVNGTYSYPTDPAYAENAADLVELRVKPLRRSTAFRITLNTLIDPALVATTLAIGDSPELLPLPHGAGASAPAEYFLTVHGTEAELVPAAGGPPSEPAPIVRVSTRRNQFDVRVPKAAWNPGTDVVRLAAAVGLWDEAADSYLVPGDSADADSPGGAGGLERPTAFFNAAFRFAEPMQSAADAQGVFTDPRWWRDEAQADALAAGDLSPFHARVDFAKLRRGSTDLMRGQPEGVPASGPMNRILSSRFATGEGADWALECGEPTDCTGQMTGRLQPYAIYVPERPPPKRGYGLTLLLHSLGANYNQFSGSNNQAQLGERGAGSIVITPAGRGPDGWYYGTAGADTFEVWADVARHFRLDPAWTAISGYSMGGYGTYKLATQYPDLFARANPVVGPPGLGIWVPPANPQPGGAASNTNAMLASVRQIPFLIWAASADELVPLASTTAQAETFDRLGYRYMFDVFTPGDHFTLAVHDQYGPAADFLGTARVRRNPAHVSYVVNPTMDFADRATVADHAYWLSGLRLRESATEAPLGKVDAVSHGFGRADPEPLATVNGAGTLGPGTFGQLPYVERAKDWGPEVAASRRDALTLEVENLRRVRVHPERARLSCKPELEVDTDGPLTVVLAGCDRRLRFG